MQENYQVGIYCRLSHEDERAGESVSIENQKELLTRYVREQGWTIADYYVDDGVSGTTFDREGFNRLVQDARDGKINLAICKDLSRLGRDYIEAGKYTDIVFPSLGCRFIALNDGVDTARKNNEMVVILKNVMNDLYARDTSNKIKAVKQSSFKAGKYVGCYAPYGYRKSAEDKHVLEIDPVAAPVVRKIFDLRCQGWGFRKIAQALNGEKIPTPRDYYYQSIGKSRRTDECPYWQTQTVKAITRNEAYIGNMVQNKTGNVSYKIHRQVSKPEEEWVRVENTHPPIISQEVWDMVRSMDHKRPGRSMKNEAIHLYAGVLRCADCGAPMRYFRDYHKCKDGTPVNSTYERYLCGTYCYAGKHSCTTHTISPKVLTELLLTDIRLKARWAQNDPEGLVEKIREQRQQASTEQVKAAETALKRVEKRLSDLEKLVTSVYEDKVMGRIPETVCTQLLNRYEAERAENVEEKAKLSKELESYRQDSGDTEQWIGLIRDYSRLEEIDRATLLRLVDRIEVGERQTDKDGNEYRDIHIYYNFVGYIAV